MGGTAVVAGVVVAVTSTTTAPAPVAASTSSPMTAAPVTTAAPTKAASPTSAPAGHFPAPPTVGPEMLAAEQEELAATAALLDTSVRPSAPAEWDRWLPAGKPARGTTSEEDMATCPQLSDRLRAQLGVKFSYWTGTLPSGSDSLGCKYATVPLQYGPDPYDYAYVITVGYADRTVAEKLWGIFYEHQGAVCPQLDVPAVAPGAVLVRCEDTTTSYALRLPDGRRDGEWLLLADTREKATHPASYALTTLVDAVEAVYG
jgi:hypothetical protein